MTASENKLGIRILFILGILALIFGGISLLLAVIYSLPLLMSDPVTFLTGQLLPSLIFITLGAFLVQKSKNKPAKTIK